MPNIENWNEIQDALNAPFGKDELEWRAIQTSKDKTSGLAYAYVTPRAVMDRLDAVCPDWDVDTEVIPTTDSIDRVLVKATISIRFDGRENCLGSSIFRTGHGESVIRRSDNGFVTNEPWKSAESDAIKRAAVLFGIGRYLYSLPSLWLPYDGFKFTVDPYDAVFNEDGSIKAEAIAKNTKRKTAKTTTPTASKPTPKIVPKPKDIKSTTLDIKEPDFEDELEQTDTAPTVATGSLLTSWFSEYGIEDVPDSKEDQLALMHETISSMNDSPITKAQLKVIVEMSEKKSIPLPENLAELNIKSASPVIGALLQKK